MGGASPLRQYRSPSLTPDMDLASCRAEASQRGQCANKRDLRHTAVCHLFVCNKVELGSLSVDADKRSKCPAIVFRDSFPFEIVRHRASEKWIVCYCQPCKRSLWICVSAHLSSGDGAPRVLPFVSGLSAALKTLGNKFRKHRREISCGADANVQFNMIDDDAGKLGPVQTQTTMQS